LGPRPPRKGRLEKVKEAFRADTAPAEAALWTFEAKLEVLASNVTPRRRRGRPHRSPRLRMLDGELAALHATGRVGQDIRTFVDEEPRSPVSRGQLGLRNDRASPRGPRRS
jgi:hypothetical protein